MKDKVPFHPTNTELEILNILWKQGKSTVREVHEELNKNRKKQVGYTTTLKMLQVMTEKKLVKRNEAERPAIYQAKQPQGHVQKQLIRDLLNRVFGGSTKQLIMQALSNEQASEEEIVQIEMLLSKYEGDDK